MTTMIPPTVFNQILQTKSSPEATAALLNEAENTYSDKPKHWNAKRQYPFWKPCQVCGEPFQCMTKEQATRNKTCSQDCANILIARAASGENVARQKRVYLTCPVCGKAFWRHKACAERTAKPTCSRKCNGSLRGAEWKRHAHKGHAAWTPESKTALVERMTGASNPAWKGGVTYWRKHGNYAPIKYVRCPVEYSAMARKDNYVMEHRLIVAQHLGRTLKRSEVVHHINHDPTDNRSENLMLFASNTAHKKHEATGQPAPLWRL